MQTLASLLLLTLATSYVVYGFRVKREDSISFFNCGDPDQELLTITSFEVSPENVVFPGNASVTITADVNQEIEAPISAELYREMNVNITDDFTLSKFGYTYYSDICEVLDESDCPEEDGLCECPFEQGTYVLPEVTFQIPCWVPGPGNYHLIANITASDTFVTCFELLIMFDLDD